MKIKILFILLIIGIALSLINPIKYHYAGKDIFKIPEHITYEKAIMQILPNKIKKNAQKHHCKNYVLPVSEVKNRPASLKSLVEDINLALSAYNNWKVKVNSKQQDKMKKRFEEKMKNWGSMLNSNQMVNILHQKQNLDFKTTYSALAKISHLPNSIGNDLQLILTINDEQQASKLFDIRIKFTDPDTILKWQNKVKEEKAYLAELKIKKEQGKMIALILSALFILLVIWRTIYSLRKKIYNKRKRNEIVQKLVQLEDFINNGHYVSALELLDTYLKYFPEDFNIKAKRERLLDFTGNDPKKAQIAFVEAKKLEVRLSQPLKGNYLTIKEKNEIKNLLPYNPELSNHYTKLISYEAEDKRNQEILIKLKKINNLLHQKNISEANNALKKMEEENNESEMLVKKRDDINSLLNNSYEKLESINQKITNFEFKLAKKELINLLLSHNDYLPAQNLLKQIENKSLNNGFSLVGENNNLVIKVIHKNEVILGREEKGISVDIALNDKHISRPHLKITLNKKDVEIEDLQSSGGTYIDGERIVSHKLLQKNMLTLAKVIDVDFYLCKDNEGNIGGLILNLPQQIYIIINSRVDFDIKNNKLIERKQAYSFVFYEGIAVFCSKSDNKILDENEKIILNNEKFEIMIND